MVGGTSQALIMWQIFQSAKCSGPKKVSFSCKCSLAKGGGGGGEKEQSNWRRLFWGRNIWLIKKSTTRLRPSAQAIEFSIYRTLPFALYLLPRKLKYDWLRLLAHIHSYSLICGFHRCDGFGSHTVAWRCITGWEYVRRPKGQFFHLRALMQISVLRWMLTSQYVIKESRDKPKPQCTRWNYNI